MDEAEKKFLNRGGFATDTNVGTKLGTDCISRQAAFDALNHELRCGAVINQCGLEMAYEVIEDLPSAEPELIKCDYVKACNEVTMNKTFSAWRYLDMLDDFEEFGYVLVKKRG